jgi:hypothetical protein
VSSIIAATTKAQAAECEDLPVLSHCATSFQLIFSSPLFLTWLAQMTKGTLKSIVTSLGEHKSAWLAATDAMVHGTPCRRIHKFIIGWRARWRLWCWQ